MKKRLGDGALWSAGMVAGYTLGVLGALPNLLFHPRLGTWDFDPAAGEPAIRWFGFLLDAFLGGLVLALAGAVTRVRLPRSVALALPLLAFALLLWHEREWFGR